MLAGCPRHRQRSTNHNIGGSRLRRRLSIIVGFHPLRRRNTIVVLLPLHRLNITVLCLPRHHLLSINVQLLPLHLRSITVLCLLRRRPLSTIVQFLQRRLPSTMHTRGRLRQSLRRSIGHSHELYLLLHQHNTSRRRVVYLPLLLSSTAHTTEDRRLHRIKMSSSEGCRLYRSRKKCLHRPLLLLHIALRITRAESHRLRRSSMATIHPRLLLPTLELVARVTSRHPRSRMPWAMSCLRYRT